MSASSSNVSAAHMVEAFSLPKRENERTGKPSLPVLYASMFARTSATM